MLIRAMGRSTLLAVAIALSGASMRGAAPAMRPSKVGSLLQQALSHKDAAKRLSQVSALARDGSTEALAALGTVLLKGDDAARQAALDALIRAGERGGADVLGTFLWKGGWVWRVKVIEALREWGSPKALGALRIAAQDPELRVRNLARGAVSTIESKIAWAKDAAAKNRIRAVADLLEAKDADVLGSLARAAKDDDPRVRAMAALVLGRLNTPDSWDIFRTIHVGQDFRIKAAVTWTRMRLEGKQIALASEKLTDNLRNPVPLPPDKSRLDMNIADCLLRCTKASGATIHVHWDILKQYGVTRSTRIKGFSGQSVTAALDSIIAATKRPQIDWKAEHDVILITTIDGLILPRLYRFNIPMGDVDSTPQATRSVRIRMALTSPKQTFKDVQFGRVVEFLREAANADVYVRRWPGLGNSLVHETKMNAHATDASVAGVLDLLLRNQPNWPWVSPAAYTVVDGVLVISSPQDLTAWQTKKRPEGLSTVEAMIVEELTTDSFKRLGIPPVGETLTYYTRRGGIGWLIDTDRPMTAANVLGALDPLERRRLCTNGMFWSMIAGRRKVARVFLAGGAEVNDEWSYNGGYTHEPFGWIKKGSYPALCIAARMGDPEFVGMMMRAGAKVDRVDASVGAPLHVAVQRGHYMAVAALVVGGANVEIAWQGTRPLHLAAEGGHKKIVALLLDKGARADAPSPAGTPAQRAGAAVKRLEKEPASATGKRIAALRARIATFREIITMLDAHTAKSP